jgi:hypothetical protein
VIISTAISIKINTGLGFGKFGPLQLLMAWEEWLILVAWEACGGTGYRGQDRFEATTDERNC